MRGQPKTLKPVVSMQMNYSQSVKDVAPTQISGATAALVARFVTRIRVDELRVDWNSFKVEDRFSNARNLWTVTVSVEEVK
jgi:hypothetical protein